MSAATNPMSPLVTDLSRARLRQVSHWIRDDLDPVIAREGPGVLQADDVLTLHDFFQALRASPTITALDLRATGIHKAIMFISGIATRWPGRLADECDIIISLWTARFGRLEDLHPFLYGRGGRLEGIATAEQYSNHALVKRWQMTCPERIATRRSRQQGNLGFRAGSWWINPLFACHAGIIDLDSVEGGISHDKHGAYALLLKDIGELEALEESTFTYRCGKDDKGKFRLTAATQKTRHPIRVLRSHSLNSIWGPKAGVRYEGLYRVSGWSIYQNKISDNAGVEHRAVDIIYDIHFERDDPVPMEDVVKVPTSCQLDDYSEYKRLRKILREAHRKGAIPPTTVVPPVFVPQVVQAKSIHKASPSVSRNGTFKRATTFIGDSCTSSRPSSNKVADTGNSASRVANEELFRGLPKSTLGSPAQNEEYFTPYYRPESFWNNAQPHLPKEQDATPNASSGDTSQSHQSNIREVLPWIDYEQQLALPASSPAPIIPNKLIRAVSHEGNNSREEGRDSSHMVRPDSRNNPIPLSKHRKRRHRGDKKHTFLLGSRPSGQELRQKRSSKSSLTRSRNPLAKFFDGAQDHQSYRSAYTSYGKRASSASSISPKRASLVNRPRARTRSSYDPPLSPIPVRPLSPYLLGHRDAIDSPFDCLAAINSPTSDQPVHSESRPASTGDILGDCSPARSINSLPISLNEFISKPRIAAALSTPESTTSSPRHWFTRESPLVDSVAAKRLRQFTQGAQNMKEVEFEIVFKNPFADIKNGPEGGMGTLDGVGGDKSV